MNDCVSGLIDKIEERQKAIVTLRGMTGAEQLRAYSDCIQLIKDHFSEEQIEHWKKTCFIDKYECSKCRKIYDIFDIEAMGMKYCPNCGARMSESLYYAKHIGGDIAKGISEGLSMEDKK